MSRQGEVDHLKPGLKLPYLALPASNGSDVILARLPGRSIMAVYPWTGRPGHPNPPDWDDIPGAHGSTPELESFRDLHASFARLGVQICGLSGQRPDYQREMAMRLRLPFLILSDAEGALAKALRLPSFATGGVSYLKRLTLLVSDGRIERVVYPVPDPAAHATEILKTLG